MLPIGVLSRAPILFDAFVSTYDTLVQDRAEIRVGSLGALLARWLDQAACYLSDRVLLDTPEHSAFFQSVLGISGEKISVLPVGCNEDLFFPRPSEPHDGLIVLYYCTFLPLHGADVVVEAALRLQDRAALTFRLIGEGPEYSRVRALADQLELTNLIFIPSMPLEGLTAEISQADICLGGHFGLSEKAGRVIPGKIYQILAMARPLIAADTPANNTLLEPGEHALLCPPGDPDALAAAILYLAGNPGARATLGEAGRARFLACCSEGVITQELSRLVDRMMK
jgi:glycosyltransferase involved in cell wall biosynthesis